MSAKIFHYFFDENLTVEDCINEFVELTDEIYNRIWYQQVLVEPIIYFSEPLIFKIIGFDIVGTVIYNDLYNGLTINQ